MGTLALIFFLPASACGQPVWSHLAHGPDRVSIAEQGPASIAAPLWVCSRDQQNRAVSFVGQASPVVSNDMVFAVGSIQEGQQRLYRVYAIDRWTGAVAWSTPVPNTTFESFASPALDFRNRTVVVGVGNFMLAFDMMTGQSRWISILQRPVVNASPAITPDRPGAGRVFISDYDPFGGQGSLYCINTDPYDQLRNPVDPGEILWQVPIGGSSGNSPAYAEGRVFVATVGPDPGFLPGQVMAFPADALDFPEPLWTTDNVIDEGFYGGVCATPGGIFAASYAFYGGRTSANLVKLKPSTGEISWSVACNRSAAIPVPLPPAPGSSYPRVLVSGGIPGYGTLPSLQIFEDRTWSATMSWDSVAKTWVDTNHNGVIDLGEYVSVGGWSVQPVLCTGLAKDVIFAGTLNSSGNPAAACVSLTSVNPDAGGPGVVVQRFDGCGSSPALAGGCAYSVGATGLHCMGTPPAAYDVNRDERIDIDDLYDWEQGRGRRDVNRDGVVNSVDRKMLIAQLRREELH